MFGRKSEIRHLLAELDAFEMLLDEAIAQEAVAATDAAAVFGEGERILRNTGETASLEPVGRPRFEQDRFVPAARSAWPRTLHAASSGTINAQSTQTASSVPEEFARLECDQGVLVLLDNGRETFARFPNLSEMPTHLTLGESSYELERVTEDAALLRVVGLPPVQAEQFAHRFEQDNVRSLVSWQTR